MPSASGSSSAADPPLSFGIELEFLVYGERYTPFRSDLGTPNLAMEDICSSLKNAGVETKTAQPTEEGDNPSGRPLNDVWSGNFQIPEKYSTWRVTGDATVYPVAGTQSEGYSDIEIQSGVMVAQRGSRMTEEQRLAVYRVCQTVRGEFRCRVSHTCGVHVHVGESGVKVKSDTARRLVALVWAVEPVLAALVAPQRLNSQYYLPWTTSSTLPRREDMQRYGAGTPWPAAIRDVVAPVAGQLRAGHDVALKAIGHLGMMELISLSTDADWRLLCCLSYLREFAWRYDGPSGTVESRYLQGSLDPDLICLNVDMWLALFGAARFWDPKELGARLFGPVYQAAHVDGDVARATELLFSALSLQDQLPRWRAAKVDYDSADEALVLPPLPEVSQYGP